MSDDRIHVWVQKFTNTPKLQLQWIDPETGKRCTKSSRTSDPKAAEKARADHEYELNHNLHVRTSKMAWKSFRDLFEAEYLPGLRASTQEKYRSVLDVFEQEMHPKRIADVNERFVSRFLQALRHRDPAARRAELMKKDSDGNKETAKKKKKRKKAGAKEQGPRRLAEMTIRNYMVALRTTLKWAADQKMIPAVPKFPKVKVSKKRPQPIPTESFERLLAAEKDPLWRAFICCGWLAGLRLSEAWKLQWEPSDGLPWVDFEADRIVLPATFAKSAEDQWVPLHPQLREILQPLPREGSGIFPFTSKTTGRPLTRSGITTHIRTLASHAGVRLTMHQLRKGFGCRVASKLGKGNAPILHRLMRHSSMQITMDYYANVDDVLHDAIESLL